MQARMFSHYIDLSSVLFEMAFQVKFLANRGDNSSPMYMRGTSTMFACRLLGGKTGVLDISDSSKECYCPVRENYISSDPHIASTIYALLETNALPEDMPEYHFENIGMSQDGRSQFRLRVSGTKDEIIRFTDAVIEISKKQLKLAVHKDQEEQGRQLK